MFPEAAEFGRCQEGLGGHWGNPGMPIRTLPGIGQLPVWGYVSAHGDSL